MDRPVPLPENMLSSSTSRRAWNGVRVEVTEFHCAGRVAHRLHTDDIRLVRDASLTFDLAALGERLGAEFDADAVATPRLRFADDRIWTLVRLLADAVDDPDPSAQLYGDGLTAAIAAQLFNDRSAPAAQRARGLAPWELRRVVEYLKAHLPTRVELARLAAIADLSQSHFSRAFKASTGMSPYRWQLDARVRRAQVMLFDTRMSLEQVARSTGFADAVHLGRTFRKLTGATPAAWRRAIEETEHGPAARSD